MEEVLLHARESSLTSILLCLEKIAVSHGPFNGLDSLNEEPKDSGILTTTKQKIVDDWSIHFWREIRDGNREKLF